MEETLRRLMSSYEEEKKSLETSIKEYVDEGEYILASYHRSALSRLNRNIQILKAIDNPFMDKINLHKARLNALENMLGHADVFYPREIIEASILNQKELIKQFEEKAKYSGQNMAENILDQAFSELFGRKIRHFKIHLDREKGFYFKISYPHKSLSITFPNIRDLQKNNTIYYGQMDALIAKGFILSKGKNKLSRTLHGSKEKLREDFNRLFSRIVMDVFFARNFEDKSAIEFGPSVRI